MPDHNNPAILYWLAPAISFIISIITSSGGISGAFLLLPAQIFLLGSAGTMASSTNHLYNIVAIPGGLYKYIKEGRMLWKLVMLVVMATLPGVFIGVFIRVKYLEDVKSFSLFAGFVLLYITIKLLSSILSKNKDKGEQKFLKAAKGKALNELPKVKVTEFTLSLFQFEFLDEIYSASSVSILIVSFIAGIIGGAYGIGGGAILAPIYIALYKFPVYAVSGATLAGTFITSLAAIIIYQIISYFYPAVSIAPDYVLGALFGLGGLAGIYTSAALQKKMPAIVIKWILVFVLLIVSIKFLSSIYSLF
jgi:uncharacterized membrane protein YfcA